MGTTCGSLSLPAVLASLNNRSRNSAFADIDAGNSFSAMVRFLLVS